MNKSHDEYLNELREHRYALQSLTVKMQGIQVLIDDLAESLCDEATSARELVSTADAVKTTQRRNIGPKHFRLLAILNEYGPMHREHVAKLLGVKVSTLGQLANQVRKHHLGDLRSRRGVYTLHAVGDDVTHNDNFTIL